MGREPEDPLGPDLTEKVLMVASTLFTLALFSYVAWQAAVSPPTAVPRVAVTGVDTGAQDGVHVEVTLRNVGGEGLESVDVEVTCGATPVDVNFEHLPAGGMRVALVACPTGTTQIDARIVAWRSA